jgi:hypothetical protein
MRRLLVCLYPPTWRSQYADEFRAVLEQERLTLFVVLDIVLGAADAWLTPAYRPTLPRSNRRAFRFGSTLALVVAVIFGELYAFHPSPAQASPRFPVYFGVTRQIYPAVTVNVTNLGRSIPHLTLFARFGQWHIDSVRTWRSARSGPMRAMQARALPHRDSGEVLDLGHLPVGDSATVTFNLSRNGVAQFGPGPIPYTVWGYGNLRADGQPDRSAPLTGKPSHFGSGSLLLIKTQPACGGDELTHMTLSRYQVQASGTVTSGATSVLKETFLNCGKPIRHLILSLRLKRWPGDGVTHIAGVIQDGTLVRVRSPRWLSGAMAAGSVVCDFGPLPTAAEMRVTIATSSDGSGASDVLHVYARLSPNGRPDPKSLVYSGADTWSQTAP